MSPELTPVKKDSWLKRRAQSDESRSSVLGKETGVGCRSPSDLCSVREDSLGCLASVLEGQSLTILPKRFCVPDSFFF